jgi:MinD-like ATPase involved in chromosome partitioning or flagellar assembly
VVSRPVPVVKVARGPGEERPARTVERALGGPAGQRMRGWHDRVTLVPGGAGPGRSGAENQEERDKARARLPLPGPCRVVVLGCTSGAGQTVIALLTARLLASLRGEPVGALDLNPGSGSLARRAGAKPAGFVRDLLAGTFGVDVNGHLPNGHTAGRLEVISSDPDPTAAKALDERDYAKIGGLLSARYGISLVDPGASAVARVLDIADQLVLVAPASGEAPRAVSMTQEWLQAHDHRGLAARTVLVVNGVSSRSMPDVERAEAIASGRCRAIVRVPWEDQLDDGGGPCAGGPLRLPARQALTALAGVLVSGLAAAGSAAAGSTGAGSTGAGSTGAGSTGAGSTGAGSTGAGSTGAGRTAAADTGDA